MDNPTNNDTLIAALSSGTVFFITIERLRGSRCTGW